MLRITKIQESAHDVLLKLEGKLTDQWAALLDGECRAILRQKKNLFLECSRLDYVDSRGVEILNNFPRKHVTLMSAPRFVVELLHVGGGRS